jgi:hypothetical protein
MVKVTDKNRDKIIEDYVHELIDTMDWDSLYSFAYEQLVQSKGLMDNVPLENEILEYYPNILKD